MWKECSPVSLSLASHQPYCPFFFHFYHIIRIAAAFLILLYVIYTRLYLEVQSDNVFLSPPSFFPLALLCF